MKNASIFTVLAMILLASCEKSLDKTQIQIDSLRTAHQALYNQTMDIHDEVMPAMDKLYRLKKSLQDSLAKTSGLSAEAKIALENKIQFVDSASESMMVWMRQFNPMDSVASKEYGDYMKAELEKVKQVKVLMLDALKK